MSRAARRSGALILVTSARPERPPSQGVSSKKVAGRLWDSLATPGNKLFDLRIFEDVEACLPELR